jgi:ceramide glucosyltransferase
MNFWQWVICVGALGPLVYYLLAIYCTWDYFRGVRKAPAPDGTFTPPVSILKPVRGVDREAYENFASFCRQDYPEYEIVFAVSDVDDEVIPLIEKLQEDFPTREIRLLVGAPRVGANSKVNKLCQLVSGARHEVLVISDSDARVESDYLREMVAPLAKKDVGIVTTLFRGMTGGSFFSVLDALTVPAESAPSALVARKLEGNMKFAFGWSMATTKHHLAEIGGFEAIADHHSDDFEVGNRMASKGYRVELMRKWVWMVFPRESWSQFLQHELRWSIGLRNVRKAGYLGLAMTFGLPWTVLAAWAAPTWEISLAYIGAYLTLRTAMAWFCGVWGLGDPVTRNNLWLIPVRDLVNFCIWLAGFFSNKIHWRGLVFRVKQGLLIPLPSVKDARAGN